MKKFAVLILIMFFSATPTWASTLSLSPATGTFNRGCSFNLDINLDTQGAATDGTDARLNFDSSRFTMTNIDTSGKVYSEYPGSGISTDNANLILIAGIAPFSKPYVGSGKLATITFMVKEAAATGATQMTFDFSDVDKNNTRDSNVVKSGTSEETLTSVTNGNYTVGTGVCTSATPAPTQIQTQIPRGAPEEATPVAEPKTLDEFVDEEKIGPGSTEITFTIAIIGSVLTVLGILGLALL